MSIRRRRRSNVLLWNGTIAVLALATGTLMARSPVDRSGPHGAREASPASAVSVELPLAAPPAPVTRSEVPSAPPAVVPPSDAPASSARMPSARRVAVRTRPVARGIGTLYVSASPTWATISLDGKPAGSTPTVFSEVPAGMHVVDAVPLGKGRAVRRTVTVEPGGTARLGFDFETP